MCLCNVCTVYEHHPIGHIAWVSLTLQWDMHECDATRCVCVQTLSLPVLLQMDFLRKCGYRVRAIALCNANGKYCIFISMSAATAPQIGMQTD